MINEVSRQRISSLMLRAAVLVVEFVEMKPVRVRRGERKPAATIFSSFES